MSVFYAFQGETYKEERKGSYVWSPQLDRGGNKNAGYTTMTYIRKGDYILHHSDGCILSVSMAHSDCFDATQPIELAEANTTVDWDNDGYRVNLEYHDFDHPLKMADYRSWLVKHYVPNSAFTQKGTGKQQYMCFLSVEHADHFLRAAIELQSSDELKLFLSGVLEEVLGEKDAEYDALEMEEINEIVEDSDDEGIPEWTGEREKQALSISEKTQNEKPKRDPKRAADALKHANYCCEYNPADRTFLRKNGMPYTEPHHLIPISKYRDFDYSVDVMENIVSLCSHCHNLLHYGRIEDKLPILEKLYNDRIDALQSCGIDLSFDQLKSYYE